MTNVRRWICASVAASAVLGIGCESSHARYIRGPDGDQWFEIDCKDEVHYCRTKAAEICPGGYVMANDNEVHRGAFDQLRASMMIKCR